MAGPSIGITENTIAKTALAWHRDGRGAVLATVMETWGSAPRPVGSQLAISGAADLEGSVSGGCVEGAVVAESLEALEDGRCRILDFGVSDEDAFAVGLACGGRIRVLVEPIGTGDGLPENLLAAFCDHLAAREQVALAVNLDTWDRALLSHRADSHMSAIPASAPAPGAVGSAFVAERSGTVDGDGAQWFLTVASPPLRLAIVGGAHIAQPLSRMAADLGYDVTIIDPREAFAAPARFPGQRLVHAWPDAALEAHGLDARTAVVLLTHDPKLDDPGLMAALPSPAFYVGALGSTRTHAKRVDRLKEAGLTAEEIARIDAPVGLDIGARSPAEIAVAILAEMTERLRRPETRPGTRAGARTEAA